LFVSQNEIFVFSNISFFAFNPVSLIALASNHDWQKLSAVAVDDVD
jgi:hypothetical protein